MLGRKESQDNGGRPNPEDLKRHSVTCQSLTQKLVRCVFPFDLPVMVKKQRGGRVVEAFFSDHHHPLVFCRRRWSKLFFGFLITQFEQP